MLALAEALGAAGYPVEVIALGHADTGFYRPVKVPCRFIDPPETAADLEGRVFNSIEALTTGLRAMRSDLPPLLHVQDCIAARAAMRIRDEDGGVKVIRTVHHVDDFTTPALIECQRRSIIDPDQVLVVSQMWKAALAADYNVDSVVVTNGVDFGRFSTAPDPVTIATMRERIGASDRFLILAVGGVEPRKGSDHLFRAMSLLRTRMSPPPLLAIIGGHSFQDHGAYRERVLGSMGDLGLEVGRDIVFLGTLPDDEMVPWYHTADALAFPSVNEGFGLAILEAMAAGTPTVVSTLPVFQEYLSFGRDTIAVGVGDDEALAQALLSVADDAALRDRLIAAGRLVAAGFGWDRTAAQHIAVYRRLG